MFFTDFFRNASKQGFKVGGRSFQKVNKLLQDGLNFAVNLEKLVRRTRSLTKIVQCTMVSQR